VSTVLPRLPEKFFSVSKVHLIQVFIFKTKSTKNRSKTFFEKKVKLGLETIWDGESKSNLQHANAHTFLTVHGN
jgi:hypothetical protein